MKISSILVALLVSVSLAVAAEGDKPKQPKAKPAPEEVFKKKDTNADSKLSKEEFLASAKDDAAKAKMEKQFAAKDKDKDGFLTLDEFKATSPKKPK
jgi:Ca2+-binding EF-hand superfamily protein